MQQYFIMFLSLTLTLLLTKNSGALKGKIINGTDCKPDEFPFIVSLQNNSRHYCGGTILNQKFILTAAHCVCNVLTSNLTVHLTHSLDSQGVTQSVKNIKCNPRYNEEEHTNDIAILELISDIATIPEPVKLISSANPENNFYNQAGILLGWGLTEGGVVSRILQKVDVIIYDKATCESSYFGMYDMEKNICAGWPQNGKGSCQGDSGGPLLIAGGTRQVGIISFGSARGCFVSDMEEPKVLTNVAKYLDWIEENSRIEQEENENEEEDEILSDNGTEGKPSCAARELEKYLFIIPTMSLLILTHVCHYVI